MLELDIEQPAALTAYLQQTGRIGPTEQPRLQMLAGGVSNRTVRVERSNGEAWVMKQALEKLRVPVDWFSSPQRIQREAEGLRWLGELTPGATPALIFEDHDHHLLAMEAVPQPHHNWKQMLLAGQVEPDHIAQFARLLGQLHRRAYEQQAAVAAAFADRSFFESLRLEPYYQYTAHQLPSAAPFFADLMAETRATRRTIVHGDYSPKNILIHRERLILLDHEVIHFGDPAFDLGFSMTHLLSKAHHLPTHRAAFMAAAQTYWQIYRSALGVVPWGDNLEARAVRHTLGCLLARVAGRSQLEYLSSAERQRQQQAVLSLLSLSLSQMLSLIEQFINAID